VPRFFGLTPNDKEYFLNQIFLLMYYMGFGYRESYLLPVWQREWFLNRINKEIKQTSENNGGEGATTRAAHHNDPNVRAMQGRHRAQVPAKLRRFT
jgi:hypothetical protein